MSYDSAMDYADAQDGRPNAECSDCGEGFIRAAIDQRTLCDACCDRRDAWTSALELTLAQVGGAAHGVLEVAIVPVDPAQRGPVVEVRLTPMPAAVDPHGQSAGKRFDARADLLSRLPTVAAVAASRAGKPIPKRSTRRKEVA